MTSKGVAAGLVATGVLFTWSGLRGASVTQSLIDLIEGKQPKGGANPITGAAGGAIVGSGNAGGLSGDALRYQGIVPYKWGGASPSGWDCSGMVNWCLNVDLGHPIPGYPSGRFAGHGPTTIQYLLWSGAVTVPTAQAQANDLVCFQTHIGICTGPNQMISALDPQIGTAVTSFSGGAPFGEVMVIRRII